MLNRIIFFLGVTITTLIFVRVVLGLRLLGYRNLIRKGFINSRVFIWLIGVPCIIIILLLLVFQVLPTFLFPIQIVLLFAYGISRKHITVKIYGMNAFQPLKLPNNPFNLITNQPGS